MTRRVSTGSGEACFSQKQQNVLRARGSSVLPVQGAAGQGRGRRKAGRRAAAWLALGRGDGGGRLALFWVTGCPRELGDRAADVMIGVRRRGWGQGEGRNK